MSAGRPAISVRDLGKVYKIYNRPLDLLLELVSNRRRHFEHTALSEIAFDVMHGEVIGILGRNGAGKSTLLKILAGTLNRTSGSVEIDGRVTAILELGTGFHPEYTGRENIYMGGLCLGMTRKEIDSRVEEIIAFSELEPYIDHQFKTYSSGMQARLTFSTAAAVRPDILIIDEALAVGDAKFQMKCFDRIRRLREDGKTIVIVSHDINTITRFCDRAFIIENGRIYTEGEPKAVSKSYLHLLFGSEQSTPVDTGGDGTQRRSAPGRFGDGAAVVSGYALRTPQNEEISVIQSGERCRLHMEIEARQSLEEWSGGFAVRDGRGTVVWGATNVSQNVRQMPLQPGDKLVFTVDMSMWLAAGDYFVNLGIGYPEDGRMIDYINDAIHFKVVGPSGIFTTSAVNLDSDFDVSVNPSHLDVAASNSSSHSG